MRHISVTPVRAVLAALAVTAALLVSPGAAQAAPPAAAPEAAAARAAPDIPAVTSTAPVARAAITDDGCAGGTIALGVPVSCAEISGAERHSYALTADGPVDYWIGTAGDLITTTVLDATGGGVCYLHDRSHGECRLGAGTYTVEVELSWGEGTASYSISMDSLAAPRRSCTVLPADVFGFDSPGVTGTLEQDALGDCFIVDQPSGSELRVVRPGSGPGDVRGVIRAADGTQVCHLQYTTTCTLTGAGPYRAVLRELYGQAADYRLRLPRLSAATGCPVLPISDFGDPAATRRTGDAADEAGSCHALTAGAGRYEIRLDQAQSFSWKVYGPDGAVVCERWLAYGRCELPAAGAYTLLVEYTNLTGPTTYEVAVTGLAGTAGCAPALTTAWNAPAHRGAFTSRVQTDCLPFPARTGDVIFQAAQALTYSEFHHRVVDASGADACDAAYSGDGCRLAGTEPFKIIALPYAWPYENPAEVPYAAQVAPFTDPAGCPVVTPGGYGGAPGGTLDGVRCRAITVPAAGDYRFETVDERNSVVYASIYDGTGAKVCGGTICTFPAAGTYIAIRDPRVSSTVIDVDQRYAATLLPRIAATGCVDVTDAPYRGGFDSIGEWDCLRLSAPAGTRITVAHPDDATGGGQPDLLVTDATGENLCEGPGSLTPDTCLLSGVAPFSILVNARSGYAPGPYTLTVLRADGVGAGCVTLPAGEPGVTLATGGDGYVRCLTIPAGQHAATERITWTRVSGAGDARIRVLAPEGYRVCYTASFVSRTVTCSLPPGTNTVLFQADTADAEYVVTRRAS
ncbi:hypothetical protein [Catenuloplanes atrovinosus]|uniref:Uncharacterized protein n=1 Tax=Catenuloplanes atrovinosus TaxID=137266 RepID=A0AAE4CA74_9ACTN|nr:hypothetical protein [Catenuloplanes atrovinosus]MDR7276763.1 hypothetical protein [Catenuloplanes atrovinosus]